MFSGIRVVQLVAAKRNRIPAPQDIVHISILTIGIKIFVRGFRPNMPAQPLHQIVRLLFLRIEISGIKLSLCKFQQGFPALHLTNHLI